MNDPPKPQPVFHSLGLGILMAVALAIGLQPVLVEA
jgi:hypothetical protein